MVAEVLDELEAGGAAQATRLVPMIGRCRLLPRRKSRRRMRAWLP